MFNAIKGLSYLPVKIDYYGYPWLKLGDKIKIKDKNDNEYITYVMNLIFKFNGGYNGTIESNALTKTQSTYKSTQDMKTWKRKTELAVNKIEGTMQSIIEEQDEHSNKISSIEQDIDEISQKVENITDLTQTVTGTRTIALAECAEGELLSLNIKGNNTVFRPLFPMSNLHPANNLYPGGDSLITVTDKDGDTVEYNLGVTEVLRQNGDIYDEYILANGQAKVIRRINADGTVKGTEETENLGTLNILLKEGTNTIKIKSYTAEISAKYAVKSDYTDVFATKVEMNSAISQTAEAISTEVNKKVDDEELGTKIEQNWEHIKIAWNKISEYIQMMVLNGTACLAILDSSGNALMTLDKTGQHFHENGQKFGEMGVNVEENESEHNQYISFSVDGEYDKNVSNGMAWGVKTTSDNKFHPIFYISDFYIPPKGSEGVMGDLILASGRFILNNMNASLVIGEIVINGSELDGIFFTDTDGNVLLRISKGNVVEGASINILDKISFYKNSAGSNSFKMGDNNNYCLFTDDGKIYAQEIGSTDTVMSCKTLNCYENIYCNNGVQPFSLAEKKKNIRKYDSKALKQIMNTDIYYYNYKDDKPAEKTRVGAIIGEEYNCSNEIIGNEGKGIDTYSMISIAYKAIQEQQEEITYLKEKINQLERKNSNGKDSI